jgi:hypothetical protein
VRGGNRGRDVGSMADIGSYAIRFDWLLPFGISFVSSERCSRDNEGGIGILPALCDPVSPILRRISPDVGVSLGIEDVVDVVVVVELVDVDENAAESRDPSRLIALGAGGARYDLRLCLSIMLIAHS